MSMANKSLDYLWKKMEVVQNNLANVDTPGYKKKDISFEEVFDKRLRAASQTKSNGLRHYPNGRAYYQYLLQTVTADIKRYQTAIKGQ